MSSAYQPSMLDFLSASASPALGSLAGERHRLTAGAWVDVRPGWLSNSDEIFDRLLGIDWRADRRQMYDNVVDVPRLLRWFGGDETLPHPVLTEARSALSAHYADELGEPFVSAGMCLYRDGRDSVAWHGDTIGRSARHDTMVAILSLGSPRNLMLRPRADGHETMRFPLGHGDLIVMGGSCQRTWEHAIPKTARPVGPRISVQFRPFDVS
jgi:alkylated DNA repair dioxygenase AlkB